MLRKVAQFYLLAMALSFAITMVVGGAGQSVDYVRVVLFALLSWPLSALILLAHSKMVRLRQIDTA